MIISFSPRPKDPTTSINQYIQESNIQYMYYQYIYRIDWVLELSFTYTFSFLRGGFKGRFFFTFLGREDHLWSLLCLYHTVRPSPSRNNFPFPSFPSALFSSASDQIFLFFKYFCPFFRFTSSPLTRYFR